MVLGERIKRIRTFRGLTQRELGLKLGYEERNADVRIAQYESGYRVLKTNTLLEMAKILKCRNASSVFWYADYAYISIFPALSLLRQRQANLEFCIPRRYKACTIQKCTAG